MKSENESLELIRRYIDGTATEVDRQALQELLRWDPAMRRLYARYANLDATLGSGSLTLGPPASSMKPVQTQWLSWRPLTAAAAGLVIGLFSASLVFGFAGGFSEGLTRSDITVADAGFEREDLILEQGFPSGPQIWAVDEATVSVVEGGGKALLLHPRPQYPYSRAVQILDVSTLGSERELSLELSASFRKTDGSHDCRYKVRLIGFKELADELKPFPIGQADRGIVSSHQMVDVPAGVDGWHRVTTVMRLPSDVKSVVIWLGGATWPPSASRKAHWVDDVRLQVLSTPSKTNPPTLP